MTDHTPPLGPLPEPFEKAMRNFGIKCCYGGRAERLAAAEAIRSLHAMGGTLTADELPPVGWWKPAELGRPASLHLTQPAGVSYAVVLRIDADKALDAVRAQERERYAGIAAGAAKLPNAGDAFANGWCSAAIQIEQAIKLQRAQDQG
jgi:hypothetical protein